MFSLSRKAIPLAGIAIIALGCTSPVNNDSQNSEEVAAAVFQSQTFMATLPASPNDSPAMAPSLDYPGNLEMIIRTSSGQLEHLFWVPGMSQWATTTVFGSNVAFSPALTIYRPDHLLQVVVQEGLTGHLRHYWRDTAQVWHVGTLFSSNCVGAPALINNRNIPQNLEVVVREGTHLKHIWRDSNFVWQSETPFATDVNILGDPQLVQMADGSLHVTAAVYAGNSVWKMGHWRRDSQNQWHFVAYFGADLGPVLATFGTALVENESNNTLEAFVLNQTYEAVYGLYKFDGSSWSFDDILARKGVDFIGATNYGNQIHVSFNRVGGNNEHWRITP